MRLWTVLIYMLIDIFDFLVRSISLLKSEKCNRVLFLKDSKTQTHYLSGKILRSVQKSQFCDRTPTPNSRQTSHLDFLQTIELAWPQRRMLNPISCVQSLCTWNGGAEDGCIFSLFAFICCFTITVFSGQKGGNCISVK